MWSALSLMTLTSCEAMELLWFYLLLGYLTLSDSSKNSESCLLQPAVIWRKVGSSVAIPCVVREDCPGQPWKYEWFSFKENYHTRLKLREGQDKYRLNGADLHISSLQENDSGIYHCAVVTQGEPGRGTQHVGPGTTLNVTEKTVVSSINLWVVFALLLVYSLAVVALLLKKCSCRKVHQIDKDSSTKKMQFRDVLQEMHRKKFRGRSKENSSNLPQTEVNPTGHSATRPQHVAVLQADDIYQNVKEERFKMAN